VGEFGYESSPINCNSFPGLYNEDGPRSQQIRENILSTIPYSELIRGGDDAQKLHACDILDLMETNPECKLTSSVWDNFNVTEDTPAFVLSKMDNFKYGFSYIIPNTICGWNLSFLQRKFMEKNADNQEDNSCLEGFKEFLNKNQLNWQKDPRGFCEFEANDLVPSTIKCDILEDDGSSPSCCVLGYVDRIEMNKEKRENFYNKVMKQRARLQSSNVFSKARLESFRLNILQIIYQKCGNKSTCSSPEIYDSEEWFADFPNTYGKDSIRIDITRKESMECQCQCPSGGLYTSSYESDSQCLAGCSCGNGIANCGSEPAVEGSKKVVRCGSLGQGEVEVKNEIMTGMDDLSVDHYYNWEFKLRFHNVEKLNEKGNAVQVLVGEWATSFTYNPLAQCRLSNTDLSTTSVCKPWTKS